MFKPVSTASTSCVRRDGGDRPLSPATSPKLPETTGYKTDVADFTLKIIPSSVQVVTGQQGTISVTLTPTSSFQGSVALSCGTLSATVSCSFQPQQLDLNSGVAQTAPLIIATHFAMLGTATPLILPVLSACVTESFRLQLVTRVAASGATGKTGSVGGVCRPSCTNRA